MQPCSPAGIYPTPNVAFDEKRRQHRPQLHHGSEYRRAVDADSPLHREQVRAELAAAQAAVERPAPSIA
jgi:hypothetical protein